MFFFFIQISLYSTAAATKTVCVCVCVQIRDIRYSKHISVYTISRDEYINIYLQIERERDETKKISKLFIERSTQRNFSFCFAEILFYTEGD